MDYITIKIGKLPGRIVEISLNGGRTVADAIEAAEIGDVAGYEVRANGAPATMTTVLSNGATVLLLKKIKGN
jgi:hypothetical protein